MQPWSISSMPTRPNLPRGQQGPPFHHAIPVQEGIAGHHRDSHGKKGAFYTRSFGKELLHAAEPLPNTVDYDCKLLHTRIGHFYLVILMPLEMASDNQARIEERVVALDPGMRTFHTVYDPLDTSWSLAKATLATSTAYAPT